jgi:hypothetical protein
MGAERPSDLAIRLAESVGRVASASAAIPLGPQAAQSSFESLEERVASRRGRVRKLRATAALAGLCLVAGGAYWKSTRTHETGDGVLSYRVGGGPSLRQGELVEGAADGGGTDVEFSDGTRMRMDPRTRGRIADLDRRGGRVTLYQGRAHVDVQHRQNARWLFQAGPFEVRVHGTAFSMAWDAAGERFDLRMESGVVSVTGPISGGEIVLRAGETLSVGLGDKGEGRGDGRAATTWQEPAAAPSTASASASDRQAGTTGDRLPPRQWQADLAAGRAALVVADAQRRGLARVLESAEGDDLAALADAARFIGRDELARRALLAQRRRFPGSPRAAEAAFLLGRLEDESAEGASRALTWYERYLKEAAGGRYVSEALGRKMTDLERTSRGQEALAIASDYLRRFPTGSYAHAATALLRRAALPAGTESSPRSP